MKGSWLLKSGSYIIASSIEGDQLQNGSNSNVEEQPLKQYVWPNGKKPRICILGGGFGGLYTALRLESLVWPADKKPQVLIVDQSDRFVFKPMMYELLSKEVDVWEVAPLFKDLLASTSIMFEKDRVKTILPCDGLRRPELVASTKKDVGGKVLLESGLEIEYDWLVLALGAESRRDIVPGAAEYALPFSSLEDVLEVDKQLKNVQQEKFGCEKCPIQIVVVGAGYCGVELAATLAERLGDQGKVQVIDATPDICPSAPVGNREVASKVLSSRNVELILGFIASNIRKIPSEKDASTKQAPGGCFILELSPANRSSKRNGLHNITLQADLILWTVGSRPCLPSEVLNTGIQPFPLNGRGQVETDENLRVKGYPRIFAIGDSAGLRDNSGRLMPTTAQVAFQEADYAGWNLWAAINDRPLLPFRYQNLGEMMTLGRNDAAVTLSFIDGLTLDGPLGHTARKLAYLYRLPTNEHRLKVGISWFTKSALEAVVTVQDTITRLVTNSN